MSVARARLAEMQLALMMLTRLPAGRIETAPSVGAAAWAFPLAGLAVGGVTALALMIALRLGISASLAAGVALVAGVLATGGLHEDGLADVADGFGGGRTRARKLQIMRDSQIGSYGAIALVLSLGLRWQALTILIGQDAFAAVVAVIALSVASRAGLAAALFLMPAARPDGLGKAAEAVDGVRALVALAMGVVALLAIGSPLAIVAMVLMQIGFGLIAMRQIGGQSGDVLGAMQQLAEIAGWLVVAR